MIYKILFSPKADYDILDLEYYIKNVLKSPITACKYINDLDATIQKLAVFANTIGFNKYVQEQFGINARHINFKKMAIIYLIEDDIVYVLRVIPASLIY